MPITNYLPSSRLIQPGVCTSTTRPAAPFEGQAIYETDTDMMAIWNGSAWRYIASATATNGTVLQVVTGSTSTLTTSTSSTYADTGLTATITPKSTSSKVLVVTSQDIGKDTTNSENRIQMRILRDATSVVASGDLICYTGSAIFNIITHSFSFLDSPSSVSAITYKTQFRNPNNTANVRAQYGGGTSTITLIEIAA